MALAATPARLGAILLGLAAPGAAAAAPDPDLAEACAEVRSTDALPTCVALHPGPRALRLPPGTAEQPYGAFARGGRFVTAVGQRLPLSQELSSGFTDGDYASTVYRATVTGGEVTELDARLRVPAALVMDRVFGSRLLRGRISRRTGTANGSATYGSSPRLPVVIRLGRASATGIVRGRILNARAPVAVGGVCHRPLTASGEGNPLVDGFSARITVERSPGMHAPFADQQVLGWSNGSSGMGQAFYPSLATLMGRDPLDRAWEVHQHGMPSTGPALRLRLAPRSAEPARC